MQVEFEKWQAAGNDFIIIWSQEAQKSTLLPSLKRQAKNLCRKDGFGIGADGILLLLENHSDLPPEWIIINSDGSLANHCGNGSRCAFSSYFLKSEKTLEDSFLELRLQNHTKISAEILKNKDDDTFFVSVQMGAFTFNEENSWHTKFLEVVEAFPKEWKKKITSVASCSIGNQHVTFFLQKKEDLDWILDLGPFLQDKVFQDGINVHLVFEESSEAQKINFGHFSGKVESKLIAKTFERGSGITNACGSGACSIGASIFKEGMIHLESLVDVQMPGGSLFIKLLGDQKSLVLMGPAHKVFVGSFNL